MASGVVPIDSALAAKLEAGLKGLACVDGSLWQRSCRYIVTGDDAAVLQALRQAGWQAASMLGHPGRLSHVFFAVGVSEKEAAEARAGLVARNRFYTAIASDTAPLAALIRLGMVLEAGDDGQSFEPTGADVPDWLHYLINDALFATCSETRKDAGLDNRPAWHIGLLARLLAAAGLPEDGALALVFERRHIAPYMQDRCLQRLLAPDALDNTMLEQPDRVRALAQQLSAQGKRQLAARIGSARLLAPAFADVLVQLAVDSSKTVRAEAAPYVEAIATAQQLELLKQHLLHGKPAERVQAAELLGRESSAARRALLEQALAGEKGKAARQAIDAALERMAPPEQAHADSNVQPGATETPPPPPAIPATRLGATALAILQQNHRELLDLHAEEARQEVEENRHQKNRYDWAQQRHQAQLAIDDATLHGVLRALNGEGDEAERQLLHQHAMRETLALRGRLFALDDFGLHQLACWYGPVRQRWFALWNDGPFQAWLSRQDPAMADLRTIDAALRQAGAMPDLVALACLQPEWRGAPQDMLPASAIWPLFAEQPALIGQGLGVSMVREDISPPLELAWTLNVLALFPQPPQRWHARLLELALGEAKTCRLEAQQVLEKVPGIGRHAIASLVSGRQEVRAVAARWLADLDCRAAVPALEQALKKESQASGRAVLLSALERLGVDIAPRLQPPLLLEEARAGLKAKAPAGLAWFPFALLPACTWADGAPVEPDIVRWWLLLACKLKDPAGNGLLARYLRLLAPASRASLGSMVLRSFIAQDESSGSVLGEKGILALTAGAPGAHAVGLVQGYMRTFPPRRAQLEAMLTGLAAGGDADPAVIQLLLDIARRHRAASVQDTAQELVQQIAGQRGWSEDELSDRTVPTAGLDDAGRLELGYGSRTFVVTLDGALKPVLHDSHGKLLKALPEPRQGDDEDSVREAKQLLANCRKELRQVIDLQTARLYDAMCCERQWPAADWQRYLLDHPVVSRLAQRLVWQELDATGQRLQLLRPAEDASLIDAHDNEVALAEGSVLRLAHGALLSAGEASAWQRHLKDYRIKPLFGQLQRALPADGVKAGDDIADRLGWVSDTYTLRSAFGQLGYQRAPAEEGAIFDAYFKEFDAAGLRVVIGFSGNALPEENLPAALTRLRFERLRGPFNERQVRPGQVPPVLLAEAYGDYLEIAGRCKGFDASWQSKMPW